MKKSKFLALIVLAVFALSSCNSLEKMKKNHADVVYKVVPEVLEEKGGEVAVSITGTFPEKYLNKKSVVQITPVLVYEGGETAFDPIEVQGEKVQENYKVITYEGGSFSYADKVDFSDDMRISDLVLRVKASIGDKKEAYFDDMKVADGVIATSTYVMKHDEPILMPDKFQRIIADSKMADIMYLINRSDVRSSQLKSEDVKMIKDYLKEVKAAENLEFVGTEISSYASPDGELNFNEKLSEKRGVTSKKYFERELSRAKVDDAKKDGFLTTKVTAEDWEGFQKLMAESDIQDKELILRVLSMYSDPVVREREIKNISSAYEQVAKDVLPQLRRSKIQVNINKIGFSDEEIVKYISSKPDTLGLEEILYAGTLIDDNAKKAKIYKYALERYPKCVRAANNIGYVAMDEGEYEGAIAAFEKAQSLYDNDAVKNNLGWASMMLENYDKAKDYFTSVSNPGKETNDGLGVLAIMDGDYQAATNYFGTAPSYNAALTKILNKDYQGAKSMLDGMGDSKSCKVHYLKGITGVYLDDETYMWTGLRKAIEINPDLKEVLATDMVFGKYFEDDSFKALVQ